MYSPGNCITGAFMLSFNTYLVMITYLTVTIAILLVLLIIWLYYRVKYFMYCVDPGSYYTFAKYLKKYHRGMKEIVLIIEFFLIAFLVVGIVLGISYIVGWIIN